MNLRLLILLTGLVSSSQIQAFNCFVTLVKDSCYLNYNVTVQVLDASNNKEVVSVSVPKGKSWVRQKFVCQPSQKFMYLATFNPTIWANDAGKVYRAQRYWSLPDTIKTEDMAWNIPICFASAFSETPIPPDSSGSCHCDFNVVPAIQPQ